MTTYPSPTVQNIGVLGNETVVGNETVGGTLVVTGAATTGSLTTGTLTAGGATVSSLISTGAATFDATVAVLGNETIGGTLAVAGTTTLGLDPVLPLQAATAQYVDNSLARDVPALPAITPALTALVPVVQAGVAYRSTLANLVIAGFGNAINAATPVTPALTAIVPLEQAGVASSATLTQIFALVTPLIVLAGNLDVYVSNSGNDANNGLTVGTPFATLQRAYGFILTRYNLNGFTATVHVADGTYTSVVCEGLAVGQAASASDIAFVGNVGTPTNVSVVGTNNSCFNVQLAASISVSGMSFSTTGTIGPALVLAPCLVAGTGGVIRIGAGINFGPASGLHMWATTGAVITNNTTQGYTISGGAGQFHYYGGNNGAIIFGSVAAGYTVTISGTPNFGVAFCGSNASGYAQIIGATFVGGTTGQRYNVVNNGVIATNGGGANYFPGNVAGAVAAGGQYN